MNHKKANGFSFVEIIVVVALLAIVLGIGVPYYFKSQANAKLRSAAAELQADLELARSQAKNDGSDVTVTYEGSRDQASGYSLADSNGRTVKSAAFDGSVYADFTGLSGTDLEFRSNGACSVSGNIMVRSGNTNKYFEIQLTSVTGMVKITEKN